MFIFGLAMKRSSEDAGKEPSSPSKKQNKRKADQLETSSDNSSRISDPSFRGQMQAAEAALERRRQGLVAPSVASLRQGVPPSLAGSGSLYANSFLASHAIAQSPTASMNVPSLLGNLPVHHQQPQMPLTFPSSRGAASDAESLAQIILATQLSRGFSGTALSHSEQLSLLGIANSMQQRANHHPSQALVDRLVYYRGQTTSQGLPLDGISSINPTPVLPHSGGTQDSHLPLPSTASAPAEQVSSAQGSDQVCLPLSLTTDRSNLSEYQCLIREQICLFAATQADIDSSAQGRNRPIVVQQVGIRCRHCASLPASRRSRGAVYYPAKLSGLYQAAQNMTLNHFTTTCQSMPQELREEILRLKQRKSYVLGGGKGYWARGGQIRNIIEIDDRLFFSDRVPEHLKSSADPE